MSQRDFSALLNTLQQSCQSGLNASLTPADCKILLLYIGQTHRNFMEARGVRQRPRAFSKIIDEMIDTFKGVAEDAILRTLDDLRKE